MSHCTSRARRLRSRLGASPPPAFPFLRTTLIASTALALVGYVLYPAAAPRLANMGFDTVTSHTGLDLSSDLLGSFYNPIAAVPSLHFGYALIVGVALAQLAAALLPDRRRALPRAHAPDHRRHGQPLLRRRGAGRPRRRSRLARRLAALGARPAPVAEPVQLRAHRIRSPRDLAQAA